MNRSIYSLSLIIILGFAFFLSIFTVEQRSLAIVFQFGEAVRTINSPGIHFKIPFIQNIEFFDNRLLIAEAEAKELTASDGKRILVDAFARFKINDLVKFYKTVHNYQGVRLRLNKILESSMRKVIGTYPLITLLSDERPKIMLQIRQMLNEEAQLFGIDIIDVRIVRADLPKENSASIYQRMQTERQKEAMQIRAEGREEAIKIKSKTDTDSKIILAESYKKAEIIRGEGDEIASQIYNNTYMKDPEFFKFYKTLSTYRNTFDKDNTTFVLSPNSDFLKLLNIGQ